MAVRPGGLPAEGGGAVAVYEHHDGIGRGGASQAHGATRAALRGDLPTRAFRRGASGWGQKCRRTWSGERRPRIRLSTPHECAAVQWTDVRPVRRAAGGPAALPCVADPIREIQATPHRRSRGWPAVPRPRTSRAGPPPSPSARETRSASLPSARR